MLEAHAPHEAIQSWKGFFVHIATIVIGLFIAVGLEQSVEFFHHRHQRVLLEEQIHAVFEDDLRLIDSDTKRLSDFRSYLANIQSSVAARRRGQQGPPAIRADDTRQSNRIALPSLAPYEAAKENGTVALLSSQHIRLYNRVAFARELLLGVYLNWFEGQGAIEAFQRRFDTSASFSMFVDPVTLTPTELTEYQALVGTLLSRTDWMILRLRLFGDVIRGVLNGARDENELTRIMMQSPQR